MQIRARTIGAPDGDTDKAPAGDCEKFIKYSSAPSSANGTGGFVDRYRNVARRCHFDPRGRRAGGGSGGCSGAHATRTVNPALCARVSVTGCLRYFHAPASISSVSYARACLNFRAPPPPPRRPRACVCVRVHARVCAPRTSYAPAESARHPIHTAYAGNTSSPVPRLRRERNWDGCKTPSTEATMLN